VGTPTEVTVPLTLGTDTVHGGGLITGELQKLEEG